MCTLNFRAVCKIECKSEKARASGTLLLLGALIIRNAAHHSERWTGDENDGITRNEN